MLAALEPRNEFGAKCERVYRQATTPTYLANRHDSSLARGFVLIMPVTLSASLRGVSYSLLVEC